MIIIAIIVLLVSIPAFFLTQEGSTGDWFPEKLEFFVLKTIGFPGTILGCISRESHESKERLAQEKKNSDYLAKYIETYGGTPEQVKERIKTSPVIPEIAKAIAQLNPPRTQIWIQADSAYYSYHDFGMMNIPEECCGTMAYALQATEELRELYDVKKETGDYCGPYGCYYLVLKPKQYSRW